MVQRNIVEDDEFHEHIISSVIHFFERFVIMVSVTVIILIQYGRQHRRLNVKRSTDEILWRKCLYDLS